MESKRARLMAVERVERWAVLMGDSMVLQKAVMWDYMMEKLRADR